MKFFHVLLLSTFLFPSHSYGMPPKKKPAPQEDAAEASRILPKNSTRPKTPTSDSEESHGIFAKASAQSTSGSDNSYVENPLTEPTPKPRNTFKKAVSSHIQSLATTFNEAEVPDDAKPGSGMTAKRVLIALSALLMEKTGCAAVYMNKQVDSKKLWISTNNGKPEKVVTVFINLLNGEVEPRRAQMIEDSGVLEVLNISTSARASQERRENTVRNNAEKTTHWAKKIINLQEHMDEASDLGFIADCLLNHTTKINYIKATGPHAEMNILNELYNCNKLQKGGFLAISKQCCLHCAAAIQAVNNIPAHLNQYQANGCHFNIYEWQVPDFIKNDENILKNFIGKEAFSVYKKNPKQQDHFLNAIKTLNSSIDLDVHPQRTTAQIPTTTESPTQIIDTSDETQPSIKQVNLKTENRFSTSNEDELSPSSSSPEEKPKKVKHQAQGSKGKSGTDIKDKPSSSSPKTDKKRKSSSKSKASDRNAGDSEKAEKKPKSRGTEKEKNPDPAKGAKATLKTKVSRFEDKEKEVKSSSSPSQTVQKQEPTKKKIKSRKVVEV